MSTGPRWGGIDAQHGDLLLFAGEHHELVGASAVLSRARRAAYRCAACATGAGALAAESGATREVWT
jgi:hypothetical protein